MGLVDHTVVGYYALVVGSVEQEQAPERVRKGLASVVHARMAWNQYRGECEPVTCNV